jgi:flagellar protein FlgJ
MSDAIQSAGSTPQNAAASLASRFARKPAANTIDKASQDFEGMFMAQMLQPMFETVGVDPVFGGGHGEEVMRGFLIQEYGKAMAKNSHFGIANAVRNELIVAQQKQHENQQTSNAGSAASTYGATNAAGSIQ